MKKTAPPDRQKALSGGVFLSGAGFWLRLSPAVAILIYDLETDREGISQCMNCCYDALGRGIRLALEGGGLRVTVCRTLAEGRRTLEDGAFDLLILDVNLPDGNGLDFLRTLRRDHAVPVILLTANDLETDIVTGLELGADDYITKPLTGWSSSGTGSRWS